MKTNSTFTCTLVFGVLLSLTSIGHAQSASKARLKPGATAFVNAMPDGFDSYLKAAMIKKKVPLSIVESKDLADFEIRGTTETQKASTAKKVLQLNFKSDEQASIAVADRKSGEIVFAYSVNKKSAANGKQSTAEACAKHMKDAIEKGK